MHSSAAIAIGFQPSLLQTLRRAEPSCEMLSAEGASAALLLLRSQKFNAVFVDSAVFEGSPREFSQLRQAAPDVPTAVVGPHPSGDMLARLADDTRLSFLSVEQSDSAFSLAARKLLLPRESDRLVVQHGDYQVSGRIDGHLFEYPLRDVSNRGISFAVPIGASLAGLLPGVVVSELTVRDRARRPLFGPANATIRRSQSDPANADAPWYVGLAFDAQTTVVSPHKRVIKEPVPVLASLRKSIQGHAQFVVELPDEELGFLFREASIELGADVTLALGGNVTGRLRPHDAVRLTFSHHGQSYVGMTSVVEAGDRLRLAIPRTLRVYHRRGSPRHRPTAERPYQAHLRARLVGCDETFAVRDLNATGLSVEVDSSRQTLPPGLLVEVALAIPDGGEPLRLKGVVRTLRALPIDPAYGEVALARCGIELSGFSEEGHRRLCDSLLVDGFPHVEASQPEDFEAVRQMIAETKFGFQLYGDGSERNTAILRHAFEHLEGPGRKVGFNLLYRREGVLHGQISGLRVYSRTWFATSLATLQHGLRDGMERTSRVLTLGISEYLEHEPSCDFIRMMWEHDRRFADRMFGWVGRMIYQPGLSEMHDFNVLMRPSEAGPVPIPEGVSLSDSTPEHLALAERYFARTVDVVRIWAEDLTRDGLRLRELSGLYAAAGLERRRDVHVAHLEGQVAGFSLLEYMTPGLQMADMASGFDVFVLPEVPESERARVAEALVADAIGHYRALGAPYAVVQTHLSDMTPFTQAGFTFKALVRTRFIHTTLFRAWAEFSELVFRDGEERAQRRAQRRFRHELVSAGRERGRDTPPDQPGGD